MSEHAMGSTFFCNLGALSMEEQQRRRELASAVSRAMQRRLELSNGYALMLDAQKIDLDALNEWSALEKRCCPFLNFQVFKHTPGQGLTLELTGTRGVKEFLRIALS